MNKLRVTLFGKPANPPRWVDQAPLWIVIPATFGMVLLGLAVLVTIGLGILLLE